MAVGITIFLIRWWFILRHRQAISGGWVACEAKGNCKNGQFLICFLKEYCLSCSGGTEPRTSGALSWLPCSAPVQEWGLVLGGNCISESRCLSSDFLGSSPSCASYPGKTSLPAVGVTAVSQNYSGAVREGKDGRWSWSRRKNDCRKPAQEDGSIFMACCLEE